jgi:hypothetical protein
MKQPPTLWQSWISQWNGSERRPSAGSELIFPESTDTSSLAILTASFTASMTTRLKSWLLLIAASARGIGKAGPECRMAMRCIKSTQLVARKSVAVQFNQSLLLSLEADGASATAEAPSASSASELWR